MSVSASVQIKAPSSSAAPKWSRLQLLTINYSSRLFQFIDRISRRRVLSCLLAGIIPVAIRLAVLPLMPIPEPAVQDEFSYLLGADTFASGRLTNPPHPMWVHFETFHVNQQPTYTTKYPPMQPLFLGFGQRVFGRPWYGVCISFGLMCAALCWMLRGWMPPVYALLGTLAAMAQVGISGYWLNSYWGGAVPAIGGCLLLGALPRLLRGGGAMSATAAALGLIILANCRPYEGLVTSLAAGVVLLWWMKRRKRKFSELLTPRILLPFVCVLGLGVLATAYYNYRVTGNPLTISYMVYERAYASTPPFYLLPPVSHPPVYRHEEFRRMWAEWEDGHYYKTRQNPLRIVFWVARVLQFYFSTLFGLAFVGALLLTRSTKIRVAMIIMSVLAAGLLMEKILSPHYFAAALGLVMVPVMFSMRWLRIKAQRFGPALVLLFVAVGWVADAYVIAGSPLEVINPKRVQTINVLTRQGGRHLVIVRYTPTHDIHNELVYNRADIDHSQIVWARDMGYAKNRELIDYYPDREVWLLQPDLSPLSLAPYPSAASLP